MCLKQNEDNNKTKRKKNVYKIVNKITHTSCRLRSEYKKTIRPATGKQFTANAQSEY